MKKDRHSPCDSTTHRPQKRFGQNFLTNQGVIQRVISSVDPRPEETILEIGPGAGALTVPLLESGCRVVAVEFDRNLIPALQGRFGSQGNFKLVHADALAINFCSVIQPALTARVVANLPYNVATAILQRFIEQRLCLTEMTLILQSEVVDRIIAGPSSKDRGFLSVLLQAFCQVEKLFDIAPGASRPAPRIWSSVVRLTTTPHMDIADDQLLCQVLSSSFAHRRKTILNNLRISPPPLDQIIRSEGGASAILAKAGIGEERRAQSLTLDEWRSIVRQLKE